ncbi:hypothetical protein FPSE_00913 [Fusarium pseudograminearum CS3096]|uniref:Uncharacterized protein n=1 Tax=Fusarium pseudograminearum (strain CS3096) TaxID=1028729 RepID=K3V177_FUSPC|nr:hypothetical protein FPSE_00913 [Fusarium pseudograminearum CS3096]EKJ78946.1 hypothetical protein FPSE_00913 [Fusarium pseudograminearum CS3096]
MPENPWISSIKQQQRDQKHMSVFQDFFETILARVWLLAREKWMLPSH